jgi:hypothetical protein
MYRRVTTPGTGSTHNGFMNTVNYQKDDCCKDVSILAYRPHRAIAFMGTNTIEMSRIRQAWGVKLRVMLFNKCYLRQQLRVVPRGTPLGIFANCSVPSTA